MTKEQRKCLMDIIVTTLQGVPEEIVRRQVGHFRKADPAYREDVARRMGVDAAEAEIA